LSLVDEPLYHFSIVESMVWQTAWSGKLSQNLLFNLIGLDNEYL
jgi:hypothetical protein